MANKDNDILLQTIPEKLFSIEKRQSDAQIKPWYQSIL